LTIAIHFYYTIAIPFFLFSELYNNIDTEHFIEKS
jgi:hypothetical protein